jgi:arylsulfatase A-like enzyme
MNDVRGGPGWIRALDPIDEAAAAALDVRRLRERAALRAVDDAMRTLWRTVAERGELDRTVWLFLSDNGFSFGDRRWVGKACPWEVCIRVPFVVHVPGTTGGRSDALVANVDIAPTIADLAGVEAHGVDGVSLTDLLRGRSGGTPGRSADRGILLEWVGNEEVPPWLGVRVRDAVWILHADGTRELYDLARDPFEDRNLADRPRAADLQARAERALDRALAAAGPGR